MAAKLQRQLLPNQLPSVNGLQFAVHTEAAGIVGGDYFDFFCGTNNMQGIVIADVMGKGLPASMLMANLQASLRILGPENENMNELAGRINELFRFNAKLTGFISMFIGKINSVTGKFEYCNAGHNPVIYYNAENGSVELLKPTGPAIGLITESDYGLNSVKLEEGDILLLYTDGATESRNEENEEFGIDRLISLVKNSAEKNADKLLSDIREKIKSFTFGETFDDITLLVVKKDSQPSPLRRYNSTLPEPGK
jgi:sigma-B regulation protein RsbU (phosphoserine phosphatase)